MSYPLFVSARNWLIPMCVGLMGLGCGTHQNAEPAAFSDLLAQGEKVSISEWEPENPIIWTKENGVLELTRPDSAFQGIRRPASIAIAQGTSTIGDFHLTATVKSTVSPDIQGRDVIIVFGYQSPEKFYYAHLSNDNTVMPHNGIFIVNQTDRRRIDHQGLENPPEERLDDTDWHNVRVDRHVESGETLVFLDDMRLPLMTATDTTFKNGAVGFGSFDDTGAIRDVRLVSGEAPIIDPISDEVSTGSLTVELTHFVDIPASDTTGGPAARIGYLGHANDGSSRVYVNDLRGTLYAIEDGSVSEYLDLRGQMPDFIDDPGLGSGFGFFAFHPQFEKNGKLYTIHTEAGDALLSRIPDFSNNRRDRSSSSPNGSDGSSDIVHGVLLEWATQHPQNSRFAGQPRELLRLGFGSTLHGIQQIAFNPLATEGDEDFGLLYLSVGDGEIPGAQSENPQNLSAHTGKMLRIDPEGSNSDNGRYGIPPTNPFVDEQGALGEIWALGFRNPHRFSWDEATGNMFIGHIGEAKVESVFLGVKGANYGWNHREGGFWYKKSDPFNVYPVSSSLASGTPGKLSRKEEAFSTPVARLDHDELAALVGGFVYRGSRLPELVGTYLFADLVSGTVFYANAGELEQSGLGGNPTITARILQARLTDSRGVEQTFEHFAGRSRTELRFGMDADGELYLLSKANGSIWKITGAHK